MLSSAIVFDASSRGGESTQVVDDEENALKRPPEFVDSESPTFAAGTSIIVE